MLLFLFPQVFMLTGNIKKLLNQPTDEMLMLQVAEGDLDKMSILFDRYNEWIFNFFYQMLEDPAICEDLLQNTFYKAIKYRKSYKGGKFTSWIFQIARNLGKNHFEKFSKQKEYDLDTIENLADISGSEEDTRAEEIARLKQVLQKLPVKDRELLIMNRMQEMNYSQIALIVNSNEAAVKMRVHRALKKLRLLYFKSVEI